LCRNSQHRMTPTLTRGCSHPPRPHPQSRRAGKAATVRLRVPLGPLRPRAKTVRFGVAARNTMRLSTEGSRVSPLRGKPGLAPGVVSLRPTFPGQLFAAPALPSPGRTAGHLDGLQLSSPWSQRCVAHATLLGEPIHRPLGHGQHQPPFEVPDEPAQRRRRAASTPGRREWPPLLALRPCPLRRHNATRHPRLRSQLAATTHGSGGWATRTRCTVGSERPSATSDSDQRLLSAVRLELQRIATTLIKCDQRQAHPANCNLEGTAKREHRV
jgi:hypothetical protein